MNRVFEDNVESAWNSISPRLRTEIEQYYGIRREDVPAEALAEMVLMYVTPRLIEARTRREARERTEEIKREVVAHLQNELGALRRDQGMYLLRLTELLQQSVTNQSEYLKGIRTSMTALANPTQNQLPTPTGTQPQIQVNTSYPLKMDCRYRAEGGPKECILVETTPEGRYGTCTVADQIRRMQILPLLFTTALEKTQCPSNRLIRTCEYLLEKRVHIS